MLRIAMVMALGVACSAAPPAPSAPQRRTKAAEAAPTTAVEQSVGALNDHDVDEAFHRFEKKLARCVADGASRIEGIGGRVRLELRITTRGELASAHIAESTLGDRDTEICILEGAAAMTWPAAKGGVGHASHEFLIESTVPVTEWQGRRLRPVMPEIHKRIAKCVMPLRGRTWHATLYIRRNGLVASSGVAPPTADATEQADCLVKELKRFRFGPQPTALTKVSFTIP